ncbi:MAG: caspase family protein, partial [Rhodospirillales bacterium]|nr:caspase family protein [Rhodospirillales bacterium]
MDRRTLGRCLRCWCLAVVLAFLAARDVQAGDSYALLIGVSRYPNLAERFQLQGPANDVALFKDLLLERGFAEERIVVLTDSPGAAPPTRSAILDALAKLQQSVKPDDFVLLFFAGHGSQQPAKSAEDTTETEHSNETDGLDEIILPSDAAGWDGSKGTVTNAIIDDEIGAHVTAIRNAGAFVWAVFDSCHSGTMLRGVATGERDRRIDPRDLGIPPEAIADAKAKASRTRGGSGKETMLDPDQPLNPGAGGYVAFYAAQSTQETPEMLLPLGIGDQKLHGLFTYTLAATIASHGGISYRQARDQILQHYLAIARLDPIPLVEGDTADLDRQVMGLAKQAPIRQWPVRPTRQGLRIDAGQLHGLTAGTVLAIVPAATAQESDDVLGYARVEHAASTYALLVPSDHEGRDATTEVPRGAFARLVDARLKTSVRVGEPPEPPSERDDFATVREILNSLHDRQSDDLAIEWVAPGEAADIHLVVREGRLWFLSSSGRLATDGPMKSASLTIPETNSDEAGRRRLAANIITNLVRIGRVANLYRIAGHLSGNAIANSLDVRFKVTRGADGALESLEANEFPTLFDGDRLAFTMRNEGNAPLDVTVLFIDSAFGIEPWFPVDGRNNRLMPGDTVEDALEVTLTTTGMERLFFIAAATQAASPGTNFSYLAQPRLVTRGGKSGPGVGGTLTLTDLLRN